MSMRPRIAKLSEVTIKRTGIDTILIAFNDKKGGDTNIIFDYPVDKLTDAELIELHNEMVQSQLDSAANWRPTEIAEGRPQIKFDKEYRAWVMEGHVLRCVVSSLSSVVQEPTISIDGHTLSLKQFGQLIAPFGGWGMRIMFVDESQLCSPPDVELRKAPRRVSKKDLEKIVKAEAARHRPANVVELRAPAKPSIEDIAELFSRMPASQQLSKFDRTGAIGLFIHCINGYGHQSLSKKELKLFEHYFELEGSEHRSFCQIFGPDKIPENIPEFVDYFLIRKVMMPPDQMAVAANAVAEFAKWLGQKDYITQVQAEAAFEHASKAALFLPAAELANELIWKESQKNHGVIQDKIEYQTVTFRRIVGVEAWVKLEDGTELGPVILPKKAAVLVKENWIINAALIKTNKKWHFMEVGNIYPA